MISCSMLGTVSTDVSKYSRYFCEWFSLKVHRKLSMHYTLYFVTRNGRLSFPRMAGSRCSCDLLLAPKLLWEDLWPMITILSAVISDNFFMIPKRLLKVFWMGLFYDFRAGGGHWFWKILRQRCIFLGPSLKRMIFSKSTVFLTLWILKLLLKEHDLFFLWRKLLFSRWSFQCSWIGISHHFYLFSPISSYERVNTK